MRTKIFLVSFTSYTGSDSFIYNDVEIFATEQEAREKFNYWADYAREECTWGSAFDSSEEERRENEDEPYDIDEQRGEDVYTVSSASYEYYQVQVKIITKEVEIRHDRKDDYNFHPIEMVLKELERIDIDDMIERRKENPRAVPVGYATRAGNCCKENDIKTVGNLLDFGYKRFCNQRHVNKGTAGCVTQALQNLYGITEW